MVKQCNYDICTTTSPVVRFIDKLQLLRFNVAYIYGENNNFTSTDVSVIKTIFIIILVGFFFE